MFNPLFIIEVNIITSVFNIEVHYILCHAMQTLQPLIVISCRLHSYAQQSGTFQYCKITDILAFVSYKDYTTSYYTGVIYIAVKYIEVFHCSNI